MKTEAFEVVDVSGGMLSVRHSVTGAAINIASTREGMVVSASAGNNKTVTPIQLGNGVQVRIEGPGR